jgi:hypothetical protein
LENKAKIAKNIFKIAEIEVFWNDINESKWYS